MSISQIYNLNDYRLLCEMSICIFLSFLVWKNIARRADAKTGVSWREIEAKAEQVDTLMDFVTHVHTWILSGKWRARVCARNRDFARYGISHRALSAKRHADAACDAYPRGMESVGSRRRKRETARKREKEKRHTLIYILQTHAPSPNDIPFEMESPPVRSPRTGPGTSWGRDAHVCI